MGIRNTINFHTALRLVVLTIFLTVTVGAFASLGDGKKKSTVSVKKLLSSRTQTFNGNFSLRSGYNFRGNTVLQSEQKVIRINTNISVGKGNSGFTLPLRRQSIIPQLKLELGNRSLRPY